MLPYGSSPRILQAFALVPSDTVEVVDRLFTPGTADVEAFRMHLTNRFSDSQERKRCVPSLPAHLWPVLEQLLIGAPDVTACRRLNMSPRTFSRRVAELLECLGVQTRFQGGAEAVRRGLVPAGQQQLAAFDPYSRLNDTPSSRN